VEATALISRLDLNLSAGYKLDRLWITLPQSTRTLQPYWAGATLFAMARSLPAKMLPISVTAPPLRTQSMAE